MAKFTDPVFAPNAASLGDPIKIYDTPEGVPEWWNSIEWKRVAEAAAMKSGSGGPAVVVVAGDKPAAPEASKAAAPARAAAAAAKSAAPAPAAAKSAAPARAKSTGAETAAGSGAAGAAAPVVLWGPEGPTMHDIAQNANGNCWLLSAFTCIARVAPKLIEGLFVSPKDQSGKPCISPNGKYEIRLWDADAGKWEIVTVDDMLPMCPTGDGCANPLGACFQNNTCWVHLLDKAFSKFMGAYANVGAGGFQGSAFRTLAGDQAKDVISFFSPDQDSPESWEMVDFKLSAEVEEEQQQQPAAAAAKAAAAARAVPAGRQSTGGAAGGQLVQRDHVMAAAEQSGLQNTQQVLQLIQRMLSDETFNYIIGCGIGGSPDGESCKDGLYYGHAYSMVGVLFPEQLKKAGAKEDITLIKIHNPHSGSVEWTGEWCDDSPLWNDNPEVAKLCGQDGTKKDDGFFWMEMKDFEQRFNTVAILQIEKGEGQKHLIKDAGRQSAAKAAPKQATKFGKYKRITPAKAVIVFPGAKKPAAPAAKPAAPATAAVAAKSAAPAAKPAAPAAAAAAKPAAAPAAPAAKAPAKPAPPAAAKVPAAAAAAAAAAPAKPAAAHAAAAKPAAPAKK